MAVYASSVPWTNNGSAVNVTLMRAWATDLHAALVACGWTQTGDTGQVDVTTIALPTAGTSGGYRVYYMDDALHGTTPIYMRVEFWNESVVSGFGMHVMIGFSTNGSGTINSSNKTALLTFIVPANTVNSTWFAAGGSGGFRLAYSLATASTISWCVVERTLDSTGEPTAEGLAILRMVSNAYFSQTIYPTGVLPGTSTRCQALITDSAATTADGTNVYVSPVFPVGRGVHNPFKGILCYYNVDLTNANLISITVYGAAHSYHPFGVGSAQTMGTAIAGVCPLFLRE